MMRNNQASKGVSILLVLFVLFASIICDSDLLGINSVQAAWDGYVDDGTHSKFALLNFNRVTEIINTGAVPERSYALDGNSYSAYWANHLKNGNFWIKSFDSTVPNDWTGYNKIYMDIYSVKATGATIKALIMNPDTSSGISYLHKDFVVDWEGWKRVTLSISDMAAVRGATIKNATGFRLVANGDWSIVGSPDTELYIATVYVGGYSTGLDFVNDFYGEDKVADAYGFLYDSVAVYAGGINAVTQNGPQAIDYDILYNDDKVMIPIDVYKDYLGASVSATGESFSITLNNNTVKGKVDSDTLEVSSQQVYLGIEVTKKDGIIYVPGENLAKHLGLYSFSDGRLLVMGKSENINALRRSGNRGVNELNEIVAYCASADSFNTIKLTSDDTKAVKDNWRNHLVGNSDINDLNDEDIQTRISSLDTNVASIKKSIIKDNNKQEIFAGMNSTASTHMTGAYSKVESMALAYATYGSKFYKDESLLNDILYCLDWLQAHRYSKSGSEQWVLTGFSDWHDWDVGTPECIIHTLLCIEDKLTSGQIKNYLEYFDSRVKKPISTAANYCHTAELVIGSALLQNDYTKLLKTLNELQKMYLYVDDNERIVESQLYPRETPTQIKGSGFFTDGSYVFHTLHPMNATYGVKHYTAIMQIEKIINGTNLDINTSLKNNLEDFYFNSFDTLQFGTTVYRHVMGRDGNPNNYSAAISSLINAYRLAVISDEQTKLNLCSVIKDAYTSADEKTQKAFILNLSIDEIKDFKAMMMDETIPEPDERKISKIFYNMDKTSHIRDDWAFGVSMSSARIFNYESINSNNVNGWYLGDGRTEYYLKGSNMNATTNYWKSMDVYRFPGITVDTQERQAVSIAQGNEYLSSKHFVGGVELNGEYSAAAMELESYHNDEDFGADKGGYGTKAPAHKSDLTAKKAYFMLDDGVICLGSGVNAKNNNNAEVLTIVDNPMSVKTQVLAGEVNTPYEIVSVYANQTPEAENIAQNTIDGDYSSKWAAEAGGEITWDLGEVKTLGFASISLGSGASRQQHLDIMVSVDGATWDTVYTGSSSGKTVDGNIFDLKNTNARFIKYVNKGNSGGSAWVSLNECEIYPPNSDGTVGIPESEVYGSDPIIVDGAAINLYGSDYALGGASYVNFNNTVGYYFPHNSSDNPGELKCRWTNNNNSHFELWFSHGINPTDGGYAYVLLPGMTSAQTAEFSSENNIEILANDVDKQVARDNRTGITYYVFWNAGTFGEITVSKPCMVITRERGMDYQIAVSDPTQKLAEAQVTINLGLELCDIDDMASSETRGNTTTLTFNFNASNGRSFEAAYQKK